MAETTENNDGLVSIVIVHWNTAPELGVCLRAIISGTGTPVEAIVVDNASDDIETLPWSEYPSYVRLIKNARNEGYARATNRGIRESKGEYILMLNPDVQLTDAGFDALLSTLRERPGASAATAKLVSADGSFQRYTMRFPTLASLIGRFTVLEPLMRNTAAVRKYLNHDMDPDALQTVEQAAGACLLIKRDVIDRVGLMDERFPLFFNDVDFCSRIVGAGYEIIYVPGAEFTHGRQASVGKMPPALRRAEMCVSMVRYAEKHIGRGAAVVLKSALAVDALLRGTAGVVRGPSRAGEAIYAARAVLAALARDRSIFDE